MIGTKGPAHGSSVENTKRINAILDSLCIVLHSLSAAVLKKYYRLFFLDNAIVARVIKAG